MAQQFKQFVYCNPGSTFNTAGLTAQDLIDGEKFKQYVPITQLGIQAPPGTKFTLNYSSLPIIVGFTGIFQIDLSAGGSIEALNFNADSVNKIAENPNSMIIIDLIYEGGET